MNKWVGLAEVLKLMALLPFISVAPLIRTIHSHDTTNNFVKRNNYFMLLFFNRTETTFSLFHYF